MGLGGGGGRTREVDDMRLAALLGRVENHTALDVGSRRFPAHFGDVLSKRQQALRTRQTVRVSAVPERIWHI